ncbi:MAG: hypothetical protein LUD77_03560 [Clostridiales bacterium]|nr:hypothetical protein [Clostridiales bacterium]
MEDKNNNTKNIIIILTAVVIALAVIFGAVGYNNYKKTQPASTDLTADKTADSEEPEDNETSEGKDDTDEDSDENSNEEKKTSEPDSDITRFYGGTYLIGEEMQAGEYVLEPDTYEGSFEVVSDLSGDSGTLISSGSYNVRIYLTVEEGQYLKFDGVAIPADEADALIPKDSIYQHTGMYLVGKDIQPGEYLAKIDTEDGSDGYVEITDDSTWSGQSVLQAIIVEEDMNITLEEGTYVRLVGVKLREPY